MRPTALMMWIAPLSLVACGSEVRLGGGGGGSGVDTDPLFPADTTLPVAVCEASPATIRPGEVADFLGQASNDPDGIPIIDHRWELIEAPPGSKARLPSGEANRVDFRPDLSGDYVARLIVTNDRGSISANCDTTLTVSPEQGLWVEAVPKWDDDIQLVLARGNSLSEDFDTRDICVAGACNVDWGGSGGSDDPEVLSDDLQDGVEVVAIDEPADGPYLIGVSDGPGEVLIGNNDVTVRVFASGSLAAEIVVDVTGEPVVPVPLFRIKFPDETVSNL